MTLIEVLAALMIIGGSVTTMLVTQSNALAQLETCRLQGTAQSLAKELIAEWTLEGTDVSSAEVGTFTNDKHWSWKRSATDTMVNGTVAATEITLEMRYVNPDARTAKWVREYRWLMARNDS